MKILFITYSRSMLGANRSMVNLILNLRQCYQVDSVVLMSDIEDGNLSEVLQENRVPYVISPMKHWVISKDKPLRYLRGLSIWIKNNHNIKNIKKKIDIREFDLIYSNNSTVQTGAYLAYLTKKPHIWHIREFGELHYNIVFCYPQKMVNKWFRRADRVITVSKSLEEYIGSAYAKGAKIQTIYNGVIDNKNIGKKIFVAKQIYHFCNVGALQSGKNQMELLEAANILLKAGEKRFHIDLIGDGTDYKEELQEYVKDNSMHKCVTFWGYRNDVPELLRGMDVGVICSKAEAFGRVTCEYMAASMPVIGTKEGGTTEIIEDGKNGFLYSPGAVSELAEYMQKLIEYPGLIEEFGRNAKEHVVNHYTIKKNTDEIYKVITQVLC